MFVPVAALLVPMVLTAAPLAAFVEENRHEVGLLDVVPYWLVLAGALVLILGVLAARRGARAARAAAVPAGVLGWLFLTFEPFDELAGAGGQPAGYARFAWLAAAAAGTSLTARAARRSPEGATAAALAAGAMLLGVPVAGLASGRDEGPRPAPPPAAGDDAPAVRRPGVYFFLLDGYGRADDLARLGHHNAPFLAWLRARGFRVAERATAPYPATFLSVSSTLDMRYLARDGDSAFAGAFTRQLAGENAAARGFRALGYRVAHAPGGVAGSRCGGSEDICLAPRRGLSELQWALARMTPLAVGVDRSYDAGALTPAEAVGALRARSPRPPVFLHAHVMLTHDPFRRIGPGCKRLDGRRARETAGRPGARVYAASVRCANAELRRAIARILREDPAAVIALQSDHGAGIEHRGHAARGPNVLAAMRLPGPCRDSVRGDHTTVNTFRVVFACLRGREPELLRPRWFAMEGVPGTGGRVRECASVRRCQMRRRTDGLLR